MYKSLSIAVIAAYGAIYKHDPTPPLPQGGRQNMLPTVDTIKHMIT